MATRSLGTLTLDLIAKTGGFVQGMSKAERSSSKWRRQVQKDVQAASRAIKVGAAVAVAGLIAITKNTIDSGREIQNLSKVANTLPTDFQKISIAAKRFGVEQDKVADILKDTSDKVGDFLQTGGGPLADFFENIAPQVGVTAEEFRNLSGDQALGLYIKSLEEANVSQNEMTFFLEAIASDATLLLPLFKDNARELRRLGQEAEDFGAIISDIELQNLEEINKNIDDLKLVFKGLSTEVALSTLPAIQDLTDLLSDPETVEAAKKLANAIVVAFTAATNAIKGTVEITQFLAEELAAITGGINQEDIVRLEIYRDNLRDLLDDLSLANRMSAPITIAFDSEADLRKQLEDVTKKIDSYYEDRNNRPAIPATPDIEIDTPSSGQTRPQFGFQLNEINEYIKSLEEQVNLLGKSAAETELYKLEVLGASDAQIKLAKEHLDTIEIFEAEAEAAKSLSEAQKEAQENAVRQQNEINEQAQQIADSLLTEEQQIEESYKRRREIILNNTKINGEAQLELLEKLEQQKTEKLEQLEAARQIVQLQNAENLFGNLAALSKEFLGEESRTYRALFALEKAAAVARSIVAIQTGLAQASTLPFPANLAAIAQVASATAGIISTISGTNLQGVAHEGLDSVPKTGTYLLEKGERVTTEQTSKRLDRTLDNIETGKSSKSGSTKEEMIQINNFVDAEQFHQIMGQPGGRNQIRNVIKEEATLIKQLASS